jgi:hypothetical protein
MTLMNANASGGIRELRKMPSIKLGAVQHAKRLRWPRLYDGRHVAAEPPDALRKDGHQRPAH